MPGATSLPHSNRVTLSARLEKILRLNPNDAFWKPSGALLMFSSLIQNAQSAAGTLISAFGNASDAVGMLEPEDMVAVHMRDEHDVDRLRIDAGGRHVAPAAVPTVGAMPGP